MIRILLYFLLASISLFSCKNKEKIAATEVVEQIEEVNEEEEITQLEIPGFADSAVAKIQRTACFGRCPIYTLTVYKSGFAIYNGIEWVDQKGKFYTLGDKEKIRNLLKKAEEIGFLKMQDKYDSENVTDLPSAIVTLRRDEVVKQVVNRYEGPEILRELEMYFDKLYENTEWKTYSKD